MNILRFYYPICLFFFSKCYQDESDNEVSVEKLNFVSNYNVYEIYHDPAMHVVELIILDNTIYKECLCRSYCFSEARVTGWCLM